jgi:hypothetical protein
VQAVQFEEAGRIPICQNQNTSRLGSTIYETRFYLS